MKKFRLLRMTRRQAAVVLLIVSMLTIGGLAIYRITRNSPPQEEPLITYSTPEPDESRENADTYNWRGAPDEPRKIKISKVGVDAYVQKAGVDQDQKVAVPSNVHLAGWFADSVKPGQNGLSIISGHVTGRTTEGVFNQLGSLKEGDEFEIELGSGEIKRYKVIGTVTVKEAESASYLFSQSPRVISQVNLVTCGGNFDNTADQYEDRIIVSGELIS